MTYISLQNKEVSRWTISTTKNSFGESVETLVFDTSGIKCRLFKLDKTKRKELPGDYKNVEYIAYFKSSQSLNKDDRIKYNGDTYFINKLLIGSRRYIQKAYLERLS